ncbi:hypothetical protein V6N13_007713 [Hibiscus sabdariffa]|uniref:Uncharacterized protein n=1 Tax=Hibiscus sabdariffa TaxID=183260 RepID=A0ABR2EMV1_9ROSI
MTKVHELAKVSNHNVGSGVGKINPSDMKKFTRNDAYIASNPNKKIKKAKKETQPVDVVPTMDGQPVHVPEHDTGIATEPHLVVQGAQARVDAIGKYMVSEESDSVLWLHINYIAVHSSDEDESWNDMHMELLSTDED